MRRLLLAAIVCTTFLAIACEQVCAHEAEDLATISVGVGFDRWAFGRAARKDPGWVEWNGLGRSPDERLGLSLAEVGLVTWGASKVRQAGHPGWARWTVRALALVHVFFGVRSLAHQPQARR